METSGKVVLSLEGEVAGDKQSVFPKLIELRQWCHTNIRDVWHSYELTAGGGKMKFFFVFEFESKKDEMLFRLYTGT